MPSFLKTPKTRSEPYRRYVASLRCYRCGISGFSQAAHGDEGKGVGLKTDDMTCYPLCGPRFGEPGCHEFVGRSMLREERRQFEKDGVAWTHERLLEMSQDDKYLRALLIKLWT